MEKDFWLKELTWAEAREAVVAVNPTLTTVIDEINPSKDYTLLRARYPYGSSIRSAELGLCLPDKLGNMRALADHPREIAEKLDCGIPIPIGLVVKNSLELFLPVGNDRIITFNMVRPGGIFSLWRALDEQLSFHEANLWAITAGARSLFMLPKISDELSHRRLKREFKIKACAPKRLQEQWQVFVELNNAAANKSDWYVEVYYFTKPWISNWKCGSWILLHHYFLEYAWRITGFWRNSFLFNLMFSRAQNKKNLRANPQLVDTVKHLMAIGLEATSGFSVCNHEEYAPTFLLEKIYNEVYQLRNNYAATIMTPKRCALGEGPVYYSLSYPTAMEFSPRSRSLSSNMKDLLEVKHIADCIFSFLRIDKEMEAVLFEKFAKSCSFLYYHTQTDSLGEIKLSSEILENDEAFSISQQRQGGRVFCESSPFFKGCISVSKK